MTVAVPPTTVSQPFPLTGIGASLPSKDEVGIGVFGSAIATVVLAIYLWRDAVAGAMRYYLDLVGAGALWFLCDFVGIAGLVLFILGPVVRLRSALGGLITMQCIFGLAIGIVFLSASTLGTVSAVKLLLPILSGYAMAGQSLTDTKWKRALVMSGMLISVFGLLIAPYFDFPWVGAEIESLGITRTTNRKWWSDAGTERYGGFGYDSTSAAFVCMFPYIILHKHLSKNLALALIPPISLALYYSTSKTAIMTWVVYLVLLFAMSRRNPLKRIAELRFLAKASFICVLVPFVLMLTLSGFNLASWSPTLLSLEDRINNTWQFPFLYLAENDPLMILTGCGVGCWTYPMYYSVMAPYHVPLDNYYLSSFITFGASFLFIIAGMYASATRSMDESKLMLIFSLNVFSVTVQCFGPATIGFILAYAFSDMFLTHKHEWQRKVSRGRKRDGMGTDPTNLSPKSMRRLHRA